MYVCVYEIVSRYIQKLESNSIIMQKNAYSIKNFLYKNIYKYIQLYTKYVHIYLYKLFCFVKLFGTRKIIVQ